MEKVKFFYDSGPVPPPYCHHFELIVYMKDNKISADFSIEYYGREELSEEEIYEEGFNLDDNYNWNGEIPQIWKHLLIEQIAKIEKGEIQDEQLESVEISVDDQDTFVPETSKQIVVTLNGLVQAIYELSGKEQPLFIDYILNKSNKSLIKELMFSFANRSVIVSTRKSLKENDPESHQMSWEKGEDFMRTLFTLDFHPEQAKSKIPKIDGDWVSTGDGLWYQLGQSATNPSSELDLVAKTKQLLKDA